MFVVGLSSKFNHLIPVVISGEGFKNRCSSALKCIYFSFNGRCTDILGSKKYSGTCSKILGNH